MAANQLFQPIVFLVLSYCFLPPWLPFQVSVNIQGRAETLKKAKKSIPSARSYPQQNSNQWIIRPGSRELTVITVTTFSLLCGLNWLKPVSNCWSEAHGLSRLDCVKVWFNAWNSKMIWSPIFAFNRWGVNIGEPWLPTVTWWIICWLGL